MGHSMGGAEVLIYAATAPTSITSRIAGFLAESPFVALASSAKPFRITVILGRLASKILPHYQMVNKLDINKITRDPVVNKELEADTLCHDIGTLEGLAGMLDRGLELESQRVTLRDSAEKKFSLWVGHGSADAICDYYAAKTWTEGCAVQEKTFRTYEGWYHRSGNTQLREGGTTIRPINIRNPVISLFYPLVGQITDEDVHVVHSEPGNDKVLFADDVADWILARSDHSRAAQGVVEDGARPRL
ncbi:hypothetical protein LTR50_004522 [Elasticomyces elasticus]|nr:hypothetical protein LTR50_004522 [Elasticomyces elasticus]